MKSSIIYENEYNIPLFWHLVQQNMKVDMIKKPHVMTKLWMKIAEAIYENLSKGNDILLNCNLKFAKREPNIPGRPHKLQIFTVEIRAIFSCIN